MTTGHVWLPIPPDDIEGLPSGPEYLYWNAGPEFPADPARCTFFVTPYMQDSTAVEGAVRRMRRLRVLQTLTAGVDAYLPLLDDLPPGARLCNARGVHEASTAELALTLVLASLRGIPQFVRRQDKEEWRTGFHPALADRTVLIVGYGAIGSAIEDRLIPFECARVLRIARSARASQRGPVHPLADLPKLLPMSDVVIIVTPLTAQTRGLVDADFLARMRDGALLVNVARGAVVDTDSLLAEVGKGRLRAALDVTDPEPLPRGHPLWHAPGVLISPHTGGPTTAFLPRAKRLLREQLERFVAGEEPRNVVRVVGQR